MAVQNAIRLEHGSGPARLWRNNTGALKDATGRLVRYGLCPGSSDLIGLRQVTITPDMVGQTLAVFTAIEVKDQGRLTEQQRAFITMVQQAGGMAGVARSVDDARRILGL
ncbi:MAG: VRR-NUC domain-containing protein [Rhodobacteraceae bacterium]|nr:VRR-NUC domain-containing protein [Paracoccaceae bacterium]